MVRLPILLASIASASCLFQAPAPVYSTEKEDPTLRRNLRGMLAYQTIDGTFQMDLKTMIPLAVPRVNELYMVTNPAADGSLFGVRNNMMGEKHTLISIAKKKVDDLEVRKGDALWGIDFKLHPVGEYGTLTPDGTRAIYMVDGIGTQFDGFYLDVGKLEVYEVKKRKSRRIASGIINQPITFVPSQNSVVACLAKDAQGKPSPTVALIQLATGKITRICPGMSAYPDPEGKKLMVETEFGQFQWVDMKTRKPVGKPIKKNVIGVIAGGKVLIRDHPSRTAKRIVEQHGKGPRNTTSLKVLDLATGKVATLADGIPTHAKVGFLP